MILTLNKIYTGNKKGGSRFGQDANNVLERRAVDNTVLVNCTETDLWKNRADRLNALDST